jgi:hypothetical protein
VLVKLIQAIKPGEDRIIDTASSVDSLDFSGLHGPDDWRVCAIWGNYEAYIAHVIWEYASAYKVYMRLGDFASPARRIDRRGFIVPTVRDRLTRLFRIGGINPMFGQQPITLVEPTA